MRGMRTTWDIFCEVVDNFGDVGIAWRLARTLVREHGFRVRLWVDEPGAFHQIWPDSDPDADTQVCEGVVVRAWREPFAVVEPAEVVIDAFGCTLPAVYLDAMAQQPTRPVWINLEYLSAEPWVAEHHGLPSPHPRLPLVRHFFFPGYTADTGGLLVERDLDAQRTSFVAESLPAFWHELGVAAPVADELRVSLFAYENPALAAMLDAWAGGARRVTCLVPEGRILPQLAAWLREPLEAGMTAARGAVRVRVLPFLDQDRYDHLLWACDLNFVRGEDSCVRAQWAQRPFVWQAYPQADAVHWEKVDALLAHYVQGLGAEAARAVVAMWRLWNGMSEAKPVAASWADWSAHDAALVAHAQQWRRRLAEAGRLTDKLVDFVEKT